MNDAYKACECGNRTFYVGADSGKVIFYTCSECYRLHPAEGVSEEQLQRHEDRFNKFLEEVTRKEG